MWADPPGSSYAKLFSRSHDAMIRVCDKSSNGVETQ